MKKRVLLWPGMVSPHFSLSEAQCKCGCAKWNIVATLWDGLERLRALCGDQPIMVHSAYRCPEHNAAIGGAPQSQHLAGRAADISVAGMSPEQLQVAALMIPAFRAGGIGLYDWGVHVDVRPAGGPARWDYRGGKNDR